jgi:hypothetical protein
MTDDEFWDAMERKPNFPAFLARFDGRKDNSGISPDIWARWDQANLKYQSEEAFWAQMERKPDRHALISRYGGYPRISAETWARWDAANAEYQFRGREALLACGVERPALERGVRTMKKIDVKLTHQIVWGQSCTLCGDRIEEQQVQDDVLAQGRDSEVARKVTSTGS